MKIHLILAVAALAAAQTRPSPEEHYRRAVQNADRSDGRGEQFCWNAGYYQNDFLHAWQAWHDPAWIEWGVKYFDHLVGEMATGPDGYKGWIGPYIYVKTVWQDSHVGDALLSGGALSLAEAILAEPELKAKYGAAAQRYVAVARKDVVEKWDHRGTYHRDGPYGAYNVWDWFADAGNKNWRQRREVERPDLSHPFNKQNDLGLVALRLYRITGEKQFLDRAVALFSFTRSRFHLLNNRWHWNYWEPFGPWDVKPEKYAMAHWVGVHPYRNYQAREIEQMVEAYHTGVVFSRQDIERLIRTNLEVMWNQDRENPKFVNSDNGFPGGAEKRARLKPPEGEGLGGTLWTPLADFSQEIRDLRKTSRGSEIGRAYWENVVLKRPPSFARRYAKEPAALPKFPDGNSLELNLAAAVPAHFEAPAGSWLVSHSLAPGDLEIALYSADGSKKLKVLHTAAIKGSDNFTIWQWKDASPGQYRVRWTIGTGYREFAVMVR